MKTGDRVVCIRPFGTRERGLTKPIKGNHYTVREVFYYSYITLEEIINPKKQYIEVFGEARFDILHFRKLESYKAKNNAFNFNIVEEGLEVKTPQKETVPND